MGDLEIIKLIINGGSFALLVIIVLWVLFKLSPQLSETLRLMTKDAADAQKAASADYKTTMQAVATAHQSVVTAIMAEFRTALAQAHTDCREERKDMLKMLEEAAEKDRLARHEQGNIFQRALAEMTKGGPR